MTCTGFLPLTTVYRPIGQLYRGIAPEICVNCGQYKDDHKEQKMIPEQLMAGPVAALNRRFIAEEWRTYRLPRDVTETVLEGVPDGWHKIDGQWIRESETTMVPLSPQDRMTLPKGEPLPAETSPSEYRSVRRWRESLRRRQ